MAVALLNDLESRRAVGPGGAGESHSPHREEVVAVRVGRLPRQRIMVKGGRTRIRLDVVEGVLHLVSAGAGDFQTKTNLEILLLYVAGNPVGAGGRTYSYACFPVSVS